MAASVQDGSSAEFKVTTKRGSMMLRITDGDVLLERFHDSTLSTPPIELEVNGDMAPGFFAISMSHIDEKPAPDWFANEAIDALEHGTHVIREWMDVALVAPVSAIADV